ncbi:CGNR zinc finger domain-containing protein [Agromyces sp. SYSU K20354]|uniref:CGNR zinc finger domain-containing protein n=1 Tax=Agromyces cavernae TaxID=2898659 RepID=UPI001E4543CF|nr:CGNR zinc finger domain-containing protein [Agromyces cavernae]MCD2443050.1 CGNR zinc finger domain-containing protein [Agromyces cavernae]
MVASVRLRSRDTYAQVGGAVALDLVNTVSWRLSAERFIEHFVDYDAVRRWAHQLGLIDDAQDAALRVLAEELPVNAEAEVARVIALREALYSAAYEDGPTQPLVEAHAEAVAAGRLDRDGDRWTWEFPADLALPRRRIALAAVDLLMRDDLDLLGQCSDAECGWVFLDTSPRHNRRWCIASDCGNRNRVREHYARVRGTASEAS